MIRKRALYSRVFLVLSMVGLAVSLIPPPSASATTNFGPDPDFYGPGSNAIGYAVSRDGYTDITETHLKIYAKSDRIAVFIAGSDFCDTGINVHTTLDARYGGAGTVPNGSQVTTYSLKNGDGSPATGTGAKRTNAYCNTGNAQSAWPNAGDSAGVGFSQTTLRLVKAANNQLAGRNDVYEYDLDVAWDANGLCSSTNCGLNAFRIKVLNFPIGSPTYGGGGNIWVSQDPTQDASQFGINPGIRPTSNYFNFTTYFGPDCSLTTPTAISRITLYDDDNNSNNGVQPTANPFELQVQRTPRYGPVAWTSIGVSASSPAGIDRNATLADNWRRVGTDGSKNRIFLDFNINADYIYRLNVRRLWYNNTLQLQMPYASVWGDPDIQCQVRLAPQATTTPPIVFAGSPVTATYRIINSSNNFYTGHVNYKRAFYYESGADNSGYSLAGGDLLVTAATGGSGNNLTSNNVWVPNQAVGNNADWNSPAPQWTATTPRPGYDKICASMELDAPSNGQRNARITPGPVYDCTEIIGKYPSLEVNNGDVRTGGVISSSLSPTCAVVGAGVLPLGQYRPYSVIGHKYPNWDSRGEYGVFATGLINGFGSNNTINSAGMGSRWLAFGNTRAYQTPPGTANGSAGLFYGTFNPGDTRTTHCRSDMISKAPSQARYPIPALAANVKNLASGVTHTLTPAQIVAGQSYTINLTGNTAGTVIRLPAITLAAGQKTYIRITAPATSPLARNFSVELTGNIAYAPGIYSAYTLPHFVLMLDQATTGVTRVHNSVIRLDGIYATNGDFLTCAEHNPATTTNTTPCANQLKVNGALNISGSLRPYRVFGHDLAGQTDGAEVFYLRPDVILADYARNGSGADTLTTTYQTEVSPRY